LKIVSSPLHKPAILLALSLGLAGCYKTTRSVQQTTAPAIVKDATVGELVQQLDGNFAAIKSLNASVTIAASTGGGRTGKVTDYTSFKGYILMRKPRDLRVILLVPFLGSVAMDMVSDGNNFKLIIPSQNKARVGTDEVKTPSKNSLENLRPGIFFDSILLKGVDPAEFVTLTDSERALPAETKKETKAEAKTHAVHIEPDYDLAIIARGPKADSGPASNILQTKRVIHYSRETLKPYQQDIYDAAGRIVTTVAYSNYQHYGEIDFPSEIDITRPFDEYALKITITKLTPNEPLDDEQFNVPIPPGMTIQKMD
jgi:outer membrane lipoprotein-sorting protein